LYGFCTMCVDIHVLELIVPIQGQYSMYIHTSCTVYLSRFFLMVHWCC
jgi:hypothetical protein